MYRFVRKFLFLFSPEKSHDLTLTGLKLAERIRLLRLFYPYHIKRPIKVMGIEFPNPVGLAAGLDKNGSYIDALSALEFGFIEIGTVTPRPQDGNPSPRLFRLPEKEAIINRMGFNNQGIDYLVRNVKASKIKQTDIVLGINIGKNLTTKVEDAIYDYLFCLRRAYPVADYITINISSPNTPGLRELQYGDDLKDLLIALKKEQARLEKEFKKYTPLAVKVAPDLQTDEIKMMSEIFLEQKIDAIIATNTTLSREGVEDLAQSNEQGGLSGKPLTEKSTEVIKAFYQNVGENIPIIAVGGISSAQDAQDKIDAGAKLVQIYTGFIYQGVTLIKDCVRKIS